MKTMMILSLALCLQCFAPAPLFFAQNQPVSSASFTPASVSGLWAWLQPNLEGLSGGAAIASLTDWSGNSHSASQGTSTAKPTYDNTTYAFGVGIWDGTTDYMDVSGNVALGDFYTLSVVRMAALPSTAARIYDKAYDTGIWLGTAITTIGLGGGVRESSSPYGIFNSASTGTWYVIESYRSGSSHTVTQNGATVSNSPGSTATGTTAFVLGTDITHTASAFGSFSLAVQLIYTVCPNSTERGQLRQWAADNFGTPP